MKNEFVIKDGVLIKYRGTDTNITIPNGVTSIGYGAFAGCSSLKSINIPDGVTSINNCAFYKCRSLTSITIPKSVTSIKDYAFWSCSSLMSITIPKSVKSVGERVFYNCINLTNIVIPDSLKSIGVYAFEYCSSLKTHKSRFFKATDGKMQCNNFQYEIGKTYKTERAKLCEYGFHACKSPLDIFNYYHGKIGKDVRIFEVELSGVTEESDSDSKCVGTSIKFLRELTMSELAQLASEKED